MLQGTATMDTKENLKKSSNKDVITIKFNSIIFPKIKFDETDSEIKPLINNVDFIHEMAKLIDEEGDTPEETKKLKRMHTRMFSVTQCMDYIYGNMNDKSSSQFYYKDEVVTLNKKEAEYYLNQYCGGEVEALNVEGKLAKTHYKHNIDNQQGYYESNQLDRFHREHKPIMVAEVFGG